MTASALPSSELEHLVLTRFNIWSPFSSSDDRRLSEPYLEHRLRLFERYCLPAVAGQSGRAFRWLIYFDRDTPPAIRQKAAACCSAHDFIVPVYISREEAMEFESRPWSIIRKHASDGKRYLLTTRLDNDDSVSRDFVQTLQAVVMAQDEFLNFPAGYRYVEATNALYRVIHESNPFISRLEDRQGGEPGTVLDADHMQIHKQGRIRQVPCPPCWVIVVHGGNVSNSYTWSERRVARSALRTSFVMPGDVVHAPDRPLRIVTHNALRWLRLAALAPSARVCRGLARRAKALVFGVRRPNPQGHEQLGSGSVPSQSSASGGR
jgi:hypothetical protein